MVQRDLTSEKLNDQASEVGKCLSEMSLVISVGFGRHPALLTTKKVVMGPQKEKNVANSIISTDRIEPSNSIQMEQLQLLLMIASSDLHRIDSILQRTPEPGSVLGVFVPGTGSPQKEDSGVDTIVWRYRSLRDSRCRRLLVTSSAVVFVGLPVFLEP
ncbi:hypothetical protein J6590_005221 [Homalodisca vitripennis]|nr:hypothetical protein J6590_005221 [Homalodisca vitripennis]